MSEDKKKELKMDELESVSGGYIIHHDHDPEDQPQTYEKKTAYFCKSCRIAFYSFNEIGKCPKCNADADIYNGYA